MKRGFVLVETIIVITVLCFILIALYGAYSRVLVNVNKKSFYDNTEYIYKTNIIRDYLEENLSKSDYERSFYKVCSNIIGSEKCYRNNSSNYRDILFESLKVEAVYITEWNVAVLSKSDLANFEATTQNYIQTLDYEEEEAAFRIIVMYKDENNDSDRTIYQYASLRFGNRG